MWRWIRSLLSSPDRDVRVVSGLSWSEAEMSRELLANHGVSALVKTVSGFDAYGAIAISTTNDFELRVLERDLARAVELLGTARRRRRGSR